MASILPGFEYDIFISYRHKDNKYDGWVTDFVANLKREVGATFKEDISIYFDNTAHRLLNIAEPGQILIHESSYLKVKQSFNCRKLGEFTLKVNREPTTVYDVMD